MSNILMDAEAKIINEYIDELSDSPDWLSVSNISIYSINAYGDSLLHGAAVRGDFDIASCL